MLLVYEPIKNFIKMKKLFILLLAVSALISFSCNKYCNCKHYIDGKLDKEMKNEFINENGNCSDYDQFDVTDGITYELKCK
jgi:hypothetical protein